MGSKKEKIIETATRLFAKYGYHAVGVDRIIEESGVAKMTLYRNFASKDDLVSEVLNCRMIEALASMVEAVAKRDTPLERFQRRQRRAVQEQMNMGAL